VKNKTAANVYLNRVGQLVLDLRVACVELALLKSSDNLDLDIIDRLTLHLSTTTRQTPGEAIKWPLAQVAQLLADTSHGDIRSCSSATGEAAGATASRRKAKRSTERGEARAQIIAALSKHHKYSDDGVLNQEPIANNELARKAEVSRSTASEFFRSQFGGHAKYRRCCRGDNTRLVIALKLLNDEFSPQILYGVAPPGEGEREDDE
jgi:hypothetical protein